MCRVDFCLVFPLVVVEENANKTPLDFPVEKLPKDYCSQYLGWRQKVVSVAHRQWFFTIPTRHQQEKPLESTWHYIFCQMPTEKTFSHPKARVETFKPFSRSASSRDSRLKTNICSLISWMHVLKSTFCHDRYPSNQENNNEEGTTLTIPYAFDMQLWQAVILPELVVTLLDRAEGIAVYHKQDTTWIIVNNVCSQ